MKYLKFKVAGQRLIKSASLYDYYIVKGSENYLALSFTFSEEWFDVPKAVVFNNGSDYEPIVDGVCLIPAEVLENDSIMFSVIGGSADMTIVTNTVTLTQQEG